LTVSVTLATRAEAGRRPPEWLSLWPLAPIAVFLTALFVYPVGQLLWLSLVDGQGHLTGQHYGRLFTTGTYVKVLGITFEIALWTTLIAVLAGYPLAYLLATVSDHTRNHLMLWVLMPFWTSFLVRTFAWLVLLGRKGAVNDWLMTIGLVDGPLPLIYNRAGVLIGMSHALMPIAVLTMLVVMRSIEPSLSGAASTLGARGGQSFWRVYFPLSLPGMAAGALLVFVLSLGFFITPALLGSGRELLIAQVIIAQIEELMNWGFAGAVAVLLLGATLAVFLLYEQLFGRLAWTGAPVPGTAGTSRPRLTGRLGAFVMSRLIALLGWMCDRGGEALDWIRPIHPDRPRATMSRGVLWAVAIVTLAYLAAPSFFVIPVSFSEAPYIQWPPVGFTLSNYGLFLTNPVYVGAMIRSLVVALGSAALAMLLGVPAAFVLARQRVPGKRVILGVILAPMILPHIIIAIALFFLYARLGLVGTTLGLILGHTCISVPFVVVTVMAVLTHYDARLDQAAGSLGASPWRTLRHVTLPLILPGLIAAFLFAFVISLDELSIALFISGGAAPTLPKQMWVDSMLRVSPMVTAVSTVVLLFVTSLILIAEFTRRRVEKASGR
jgi:putative spermidine/putrescine transport system permease protein